MITIAYTTRLCPNLPFAEIAHAILGTSYDLSLTFIGRTRAREMNRTYRNATYIPNVLSFPLTKDAGEIYITPTIASQEAPLWDLSPDQYIGYLFIHGLLHLKGYDHGATMERAEQKYMSRFNLK